MRPCNLPIFLFIRIRGKTTKVITSIMIISAKIPSLTFKSLIILVSPKIEEHSKC